MPPRKYSANNFTGPPGETSCVTSSTGRLLSDASSGFVPSKSYRRRARRKAAAEAAKSCSPSTGSSAPAPADSDIKQAITTPGSSDPQEDILLLPDFSPGMVCQTDGGNGRHEFSQVDHLCWEPADIVECKYSTLTPTRSPTSKFLIVDSASESSVQNSNILDQEPRLELGDSFDSVDGLCNIAPLQPTRSPTHATPFLGLGAQVKTSSALGAHSIQFPLTDFGKSETEVLTRALGPGVIDSPIQSLNPSDFMLASREAAEEAQRIARNRRIYGWVDGVVSSATDIPESLSTASPSPLLVSSAMGDFLGSLDSDLLIDESSPNSSAGSSSVSAYQLPTGNSDLPSLPGVDYGPCITVSHGFSQCSTTSSSISASSTSELLLLDFEDGVPDPAPTMVSDPPLPYPQESLPTPASSLQVLSPISAILPPDGDVSRGKSTSGEAERKPTVVKVIVTAPKGEREVSSHIWAPIISAAGRSSGEVGNAAWSRWVEENSELTPGASLSRTAQRQSPRYQNTRGWSSSAPKSARRILYSRTSLRPMGGPNWGSSTDIRELKDKGCDPSGRNNYARFHGPGGLLFRGQVKQLVGLQGYPTCAVPAPFIAPTPAQNATKVAPVTWAGSGLPFEGLASRCGVTAPQVTVGYHNPQKVSYKRTLAFDREQKVREQIFGKRSIHPHPKAFKTFPTKRDVWASQEADFMRCSGP